MTTTKFCIITAAKNSIGLKKYVQDKGKESCKCCRKSACRDKCISTSKRERHFTTFKSLQMQTEEGNIIRMKVV